MDLNIIDTYGLPIAGVIGLAAALWKTVEFIQKQLLNQIEDRHNAEMEAIRQLEEEHKVFHGIVVTLIDNSKLNEMSLLNQKMKNLKSLKKSLVMKKFQKMSDSMQNCLRQKGYRQEDLPLIQLLLLGLCFILIASSLTLLQLIL